MFTSSIKIRVRYGETDKMGFMYYGHYALYFEQGRTEAIRSLGISYKELENIGVIMPVVEFQTKYLRPAYYDDLVTVETSIKTLDKNQSEIIFFSRLFNEKKKLLNEAQVLLVFFDIKKKEKINMPKIIHDKLLPYFETQKE